MIKGDRHRSPLDQRGVLSHQIQEQGRPISVSLFKAVLKLDLTGCTFTYAQLNRHSYRALCSFRRGHWIFVSPPSSSMNEPVAMKYTVGPFLVLETNPPQSTKHKHEHGPPVPGNQATWLFFPILAALILVLIAALSDPIFHGLSIVDVDMGKNGRVQFGAWGWCGKNIPNITSV